MKTTLELPLPSLSKGCFVSISALTDEVLFRQTGIRIAFTERSGGVSKHPYESLNIGAHVGDDAVCVEQNRRLIFDAFSVEADKCIIPLQIHGDTIVVAGDEDIEEVQRCAAEGADGVVVHAAEVSALLAYADCVPLILVSPYKTFAVVHAGWRGVVAGVAIRAFEKLAEASGQIFNKKFASECNIYLGAYIHHECFEVDPSTSALFERQCGPSCIPSVNHVDLGEALRISLLEAGAQKDRIADAGQCSSCENNRYFSYRAEAGICGRHGAFAVRQD